MIVPVVDFRRQRMVLDWNSADGTWNPCAAPSRVQGIALIRASRRNLCLYAQDGVLRFQLGADSYTLSAASRIRCSAELWALGFRRRFALECGDGAVLRCSYWTSQGHDFLQWLARKAAEPGWIETAAQRWSEGIDPAALRSG